MSGLLQKGARRFTTQIGAAGVSNSTDTTIPLVSVTGLPTDTPIEIVIDRADSSGNLTPNKEEVVRGTVSGLNLINCIRGVEGTAQSHNAGATVNSFLTASMWNNVIDYIRDTPSRGLIGGVINVSVASNNLTVAVKTLQGTDPSPTNPVGIIIGNQLRSITSALSTTNNAGINWLNMGSAELATREVDLFTFMQWNSTTSAVNILVSRLPYARIMGDFVNSGTNEKGVFGIVNYNATDDVVNIGRFAATLSAGAGHTWSVPAFTNANLIQEPVYETRYLQYTPTWVSSGTQPAIGNGTLSGRYKITGETIRLNVYIRAESTTTYGTGSWAFNTPMSSTSGQNLGAGTGSGHAWNGTPYILSTGPNYIFGIGSYGQIFATTSSNQIIGPTVPFTWSTGTYGIMGIEYIIV